MKSRRITVLLLALVLLLGVFPCIPFEATAAAAGTGKENAGGSADRWIKQDTYWDTKSPITDAPLTFEAVIRHSNTKPKNGVLLGNYVDEATPSVSFYVTSYGRPEVKIITEDGTKKTYNFADQTSKTYVDDDGSTVMLNQCLPFSSNYYLHVAFTIDPARGVVKYYQNGVLYGVVESTVPVASEIARAASMRTMRIGGDYRTDNTEFWTGAIHYVAIYKEVLTTAQINAIYNAGAWANGDALIAAWDLSKQGENACKDRSGNGNELVYHGGEGIRIDTFGSYTLDNKLTGMPETVEAWIWMPTCYNARGGTLIGNKSAKKNTYWFEVQYDGHPRFGFYDESGKETVHVFDKVDVRRSAWVHVAFVHAPDASGGTGAVYCYIDGVLCQTVEGTVAYPEQMTEAYSHFGGDRQSNGLTQRFNGYIKEMRIYSDSRTAAEIASDCAGDVDYTDPNMVLHYALDAEDEYKSIPDLSGNGNNATYNQVFYGEVDEVKDYAYSLAIVGDTQTVTNSHPEKLKTIYQWILDNKEDKNIQYVLGLGDITELGEDWGHKNNDTPEETAKGDAQWKAALEAVSMMDGKIPYSLVRGAGHDGVERFNEWFGTHEGYTSQIDGYCVDGRIENVYHLFTVENIDYMILCLDFGARDDALAWANEVVAAHPTHRVIITTHAYLEADGSLLETGEPYAPSSSFYDPTNNDADDIWNKFIRKHPNIQMVLCGHRRSNEIVISKKTGDCGNEVTQIMINPQELDTSSTPRGMVAMFYFSEDGESVDVQWYSTITDTYIPSKSFTARFGVEDAPDDTPNLEETTTASDETTAPEETTTASDETTAPEEESITTPEETSVPEDTTVPQKDEDELSKTQHATDWIVPAAIGAGIGAVATGFGVWFFFKKKRI